MTQAGSALEGQPVEKAALGEQLQKEREHHFLLGDHDVAQARFHRKALNLRLCEQSSIPPSQRPCVFLVPRSHATLRVRHSQKPSMLRHIQ